MTRRKLIESTYAGMIAGRRFSLKQIDAFRDAIWAEAEDGRLEAAMLFFAEALHDTEHYGAKRVRRVLRYTNRQMVDYLEQKLNMDDLRLRVFGKTGFMFAMTEADQRHIVQLLTGAGYEVHIDEPEEDGDDVPGEG